MITWLAGLVLENKKSRIVLLVAFFINVGILIFLKEVNFFLGTARGIGNLFHHPLKIQNLEWIAPLGISYYILNMISYLLDIYWGVGTTQKNYFKFVLFAGYFPILTSGPILRYRETEGYCMKDIGFIIRQSVLQYKECYGDYLKKWLFQSG